MKLSIELKQKYTNKTDTKHEKCKYEIFTVFKQFTETQTKYQCEFEKLIQIK